MQFLSEIGMDVCLLLNIFLFVNGVNIHIPWGSVIRCPLILTLKRNGKDVG